MLTNDPLSGASDETTQVTVDNADVAPLTPTVNPRAQLVSPGGIINSGGTYWVSFEMYLPASFPAGGAPSNGFILLNESGYGAPYAGSPPIALYANNGDFEIQRNASSSPAYQVAWQSPIVRGQWVRFTFHFLHSTNGWFELYMNGVQQELYDGPAQTPASDPNAAANSTLQMPVNYQDSSDNTGPWYAYEQVYYSVNTFPSLTVDYKDFTVATTQAAAEAG